MGIWKQIYRAAVSALSNVAEVFKRGNRAQFIQFLSIAKDSFGEARSHASARWLEYLARPVLADGKLKPSRCPVASRVSSSSWKNTGIILVSGSQSNMMPASL